MKFEAHEYFLVSTERMRQARRVHEQGGAYALAMYSSGLAVECMLRAFRWEKDKSFEGRHDLKDLLKASDFLKIDDEYSLSKRARIEDREGTGLNARTAMIEIQSLWHNNLRFASEASLLAYLRRIGRVGGIKGDPLKKNSTDLLEAAEMVVERGRILWNFATR